MDDFKRPNHLDFCDSSELRTLEFSGVRYNELSMEMEIWIAGEKKASISKAEMRLNPAKWEEMYAKIFGINEVITLTSTSQKGE